MKQRPAKPVTVYRWEDIRRKYSTPEQLEASEKRVDKMILRMELAALRKALGLTQVQVAKAAKMAQADISKLERRTDHRLSVLRRVVEALGCELEVYAVKDRHRIKLSV